MTHKLVCRTFIEKYVLQTLLWDTAGGLRRERVDRTGVVFPAPFGPEPEGIPRQDLEVDRLHQSETPSCKNSRKISSEIPLDSGMR
jgi:hypothetical protein